MFSFIPYHSVVATQSYSENLTSYIAGSQVLWFMHYNGINATSSGISNVEAVSGLSSYNLTVIKTTSWTVDSEVFGPNGYNLIPTPYIAPQAAFLTVGADSYASALSTARAFDAYLFTSFISYSNDTGTYVFQSPISFDSIVPVTLLTFIPSGFGGFASAISPTVFTTTQSPIVTLSGVKGSSGFVRDLTLGSIATSALTSLYTPNFLNYFGSAISSLKASNKSISSTVAFHFLDGVVSSSDHANVTANSYSVSISPGKSLKTVNVTDDQIPEQLYVQRIIDTGVLKPMQNVSVTISLGNLIGTSNITTSVFTDNWWQSYGFFKLINGSSTIPSQLVEGGASQNPTYILQYTGTSHQQITIPAISVPYSYTTGVKTFEGVARSNSIPLSLGVDEPVVFAYVVPASVNSNYGSALGSTEHFSVVARNIGTQTASTVMLADQPEGGLVPGASVTAAISVSASSLTDWNSTKAYSVSYSSPATGQVSVSTNPVQVVFSHSSMSFGIPVITLSGSISYPSPHWTNLTISVHATLRGSVNATSVTAAETLPPGTSCGKVEGSGLTCTGGILELALASLGSKAQTSSLHLNLTSPRNYFFAPMTVKAMSSGLSLQGDSSLGVAPAGLKLTKVFLSPAMFGGMTTRVSINASNSGPFDAFNATVTSLSDSFDKVSPLSVSSRFTKDVAPDSYLNQSYTITASDVVGNFSSSPISLSFYMGGTFLTLNSTGPIVELYQQAVASVTTTPASPTENSAFAIDVKITNPSPVSLSNVRFTVPVPNSVTLGQLKNATLSGGTLTISAGQMLPHGTYAANLTAQATSGTTLPFSKSKITFVYAGATISTTLRLKDVVVGEDVLLRYTIPTAIVLVAVLATAFYVRRKAAPSVPASRQ
jgi:hypothetical protein